MQLHAAASRGDLDGIAFALKNGADVNSRNAIDQTALVFALEQARAFSRRRGPKITLDAVGSLLDAGADVEARDGLGATPIHHAAGIPDPRFLGLLIEKHTNPRHMAESGYSVLLHACFQPPSLAKRTAIEMLHREGASLDATSAYGEFPLGVCLRFGDLDTLRFLISLGADAGPLNWSELHHAVALGKLADIKQLSPQAKDINPKNARFDLSPWQLAFVRGDVGIARYLAEQGGDLTQVGRCGTSLLHLAAEFGREAATCWLLELGADANIVDESGATPLHTAAGHNRIPTARTLLNKGANPSLRNEVQGQPIHEAYSLEMVQLLVESGGADVNVIDGCGDWPLKSAAETNDVECITWLLDHGAEAERTSTGETALHAAVRSDSREAVDKLLRAGANPNAQDVDGWTPLFGASSIEVIHALRKAGADPRITDQADMGPERWLKDSILIRALREPL